MKEQEKAIKEIIQKYGETINLKTSPYLISEIIRNYSSIFNPNLNQSSGPIPGSHGTPPPPPPPPPAPNTTPFSHFLEIQNELLSISKSLRILNGKVDLIKK